MNNEPTDDLLNLMRKKKEEEKKEKQGKEHISKPSLYCTGTLYCNIVSLYCTIWFILDFFKTKYVQHHSFQTLRDTDQSRLFTGLPCMNKKKVKMAQDMSVVTQSIVSVTITSSINTFGSERRLQKDLNITDVKDKLVLLTGANPVTMKLEVYDKDNKLLCTMDDNNALLGSYPVDDGCRIHVVDSSIKLGEFEDVSKVEKFELTEEEYAKKTDSVRAFKERMKMGRFKEVDPEEQKRLDEEKELKEQEDKERIESMKVGNRCEVKVPGQPTRRGCVQYLGTTDFKPGYWVGVQYDEPVGKNNGSVKGRQYFQCPAKYGGFVKPDNVEAGDFPEEGLEDMDEM